jgi:hypothetical protein
MPKRFEVVWQASPPDTWVVLRSTVDANEATIAFIEELACLRRQEAPGDLLVQKGIDRKGTPAQPPLLRHSLNHPKTHAS